MTMLDLPEEIVVEIRAFRSGRALAERLHAFGLFRGSRIRLVKAAPLGGPLMIEDVATGARVMIGRGMASKIEVGRSDSTQS